MDTFLDKLDAVTSPIEWVTVASHPFSGIQYQEATVAGLGLIARVMQTGYEVTGPKDDTNAVYWNYLARIERYMNPA